MPFFDADGPWSVSLARALDVVLRVPPLFVLDSVFNGTLTVPWVHDERIRLLGIGGSFWSIYGLLMILTCTICIVLICLTSKQLIDIYSLFLAIGVLLLSYALNRYPNMASRLATPSATSDMRLTNFIANIYSRFAQRYELAYTEEILADADSHFLYDIATFVLAQVILAFSFDMLILRVEHILHPVHPPSVWNNKLRTYVFFLLPLMCQYLNTADVKRHPGSDVIAAVCTSLASAQLLIALGLSHNEIPVFFRNTYARSRALVSIYGLTGFIELQWQRLHVPSVLRVFWVLRATIHFSYILSMRILSSGEINQDAVLESIYVVFVHGCETTISLLGMTSTISFVAHYIGEFVFVVVGCQQDIERQIGNMSAILFFILALQTGLTGMDETRRLTRLYRNICLLSMAMLHFIHGTVHPHMLTLGAGRHTSARSHIRAVSVSIALSAFAVTFVIMLWRDNVVGTWLLAVTAFSIELVIKTIITLLIYALFLIDAHREDFWEGLDDYIYVIKSTGATIEFMFGLFLFGNGAWILIFESGGALRAIMMCVHAYFNIYQQGREGWKVFMKRRTAVRKIGMLPEATAAELAAFANVCAICYQELQTARITKCQHMFHGVCLRKWLYVQDRCPMCHQNIYHEEPVRTATQK